MRPRLTKEQFGKNYLLAASMKETLWLNPNKVEKKNFWRN